MAGYPIEVVRTACRYMLAGLPAAARDQVEREMLEMLAGIFAEAGVPFPGDRPVPVEAVLIEVRMQAEARSWRAVAREVGVAPRTLELAYQPGRKLRARTVKRLLEWWGVRHGR